MEKSRNYKDLIVWQKSLKLVRLVYDLIKEFPKEELYGISSQMKRAAISIPSNIAEGSKRKTSKDFSHFLSMAYGSASELETQIEIIKTLPFGSDCDYLPIENLLVEIMKMLNTMIIKIR